MSKLCVTQGTNTKPACKLIQAIPNLCYLKAINQKYVLCEKTIHNHLVHRDTKAKSYYILIEVFDMILLI